MTIDKTIDRMRGGSEPRTLMRRLRAVMATEESPQMRLNHLTEAIANTMVADVCSIYLRRSDDQLELFATVGLNPEAVHKTKLSWDEGLVGYVARTTQPISLSEAQKHEAFSYRPEVGEDLLKAFMGVPIIRTGQVLGVLVLQNRVARTYAEEDIEAVQMVAMVLAEIVAAGDLLEKADRAEVERLLYRPERLTGTGVVAGIVIGKAALYEAPIPAHKVFTQNVVAELERLEQGITALQKSVDDMIADNQQLSHISREVIEVYRLFAYDKGWAKRLTEAVTEGGLTAESAVERVQAENRHRMKMATDPYIRERLHDLDDLSRRLLRALAGKTGPETHDLEEGAILFARALGPAEILELDRDKLAGIVMGEASINSHAAIVARSLGIPMVGGCPLAVERVQPSDRVIVNGATGEVHLRPEDGIADSYRDKVELYSEAQKQFAQMKEVDPVTRDGTSIDLYLNAGLLVDIPNLATTNAKGVGLFRTEFQFLVAAQLPTASAQEELYRSVLDAANGRPVIFRTTDLGSDKAADYMHVSREANPAMGWRGIRMSIDREGLIRPQLRALLSAAAGRDLQILLPMVTSPEEIDQAKAIINKEIDRRKRLRQELPKTIKIGAMIEVPAAGWNVDLIAPKVDFLSLGGNDLAQFFFAADRESERLAGRYDSLHPAFLGFLQLIADKSKLAGKPICYCGEQAADPVVALALAGIGYTKFSVPAIAVGPIKRMLSMMDLPHLQEWLLPKLHQDGPSLRQELVDYTIQHQIEI
ncbi:MAG: phosphoenolpyruvate--protein phosphotransferase [bacterium]